MSYNNSSLFNIKFNYLYRDASNYKNFGSIVFSNIHNITLQEIHHIIMTKLYDGEYFNAKIWNVPELFFEVPNSDDHEFHEFESIEITNDTKYYLTIEEFISNILKT